MMDLRQYQWDGYNSLLTTLTNRKAVLEASTTGYGKTVVASNAIRDLDLIPCVICPRSVVPSWKRTLAACGCREPLFVETYDGVKRGKVEPYGKWVLHNRKFGWELTPEHVLIFDEVHHCKTRTTQNAKLLVGAARSKAKVLMISATAAESPLDMFATGFALGLHNGDSEWFHWLRANGVKKGRWGFYFAGGTEAMERLHEEIFPDKGHRAIANNLPGFPKNHVSTLAVPVNNRTASARVQDEIDAILAKREMDAPLPIVDTIRTRQQIEILKTDALTELVTTDMLAGNSVVVFVNFIDTLRTLEAQIGDDNCVTYHGKLSDSLRRSNLEQFQSNQIPVIICQIQSGGQSIDLHDLYGRQRVSYICPSDSATATVQALGRINRSGALSPAIQHMVFAADTVEEQVRERVQDKIDRMNALNDGRLPPITDGDLDIFATEGEVEDGQ